MKQQMSLRMKITIALFLAADAAIAGFGFYVACLGQAI